MSQELIDLVRVAHLICFALGMGAGLYFDMRTLRRIGTPFTDTDLVEFECVHRYVFAALVGMWASGLALIYVRTGFVWAEFPPKLWMKLIIVVALTLNAAVIGAYVLPRVRQAVGRAAIDLPLRDMLPMTACASASMFCWLGGLVLGASVTMKTANWVTLCQFLAVEFVVIMLGALLGVLALRALLNRRGRHAGQTGRSMSRAASKPAAARPMRLTPAMRLSMDGPGGRSPK